MNNEWCLGKNLRTGKQGLFPTNYVQVTPPAQPTPIPSAYGANNEKQNGYGGGYPAQPVYQQGPPPPGQSNPYNSSVPPMAVAEQPVDGGKPGKGAEMGKKFGKKLGNAAILSVTPHTLQPRPLFHNRETYAPHQGSLYRGDYLHPNR
jgi:hypothetical protein